MAFYKKIATYLLNRNLNYPITRNFTRKAEILQIPIPLLLINFIQIYSRL